MTNNNGELEKILNTYYRNVMQCECLVEHLKQSLSTVERTIGKNPALPVLTSVLISAEKKHIRLATTNLEMGVETIVNGVITAEGALAVPVKTLSAFISNIGSSERVLLKKVGDVLQVDVARQQTKIRSYSPDEFPPFPTQKDTDVLEVAADVLIGSLRRVLTAVSRFNIKQELSAVLFKLDRQLTIAGTDSFRLAEEVILDKHISKTNVKIQFLLPVETAEELVRLFSSSTEKRLFFHLTPTTVIIRSAHVTLYSRLIDGRFPEYKEILPKEFHTEASVSQSTFLQYLKQARIFSGKLNDITATLSENEGIVIQARNGDVGEFQAVLDASVRGEGCRLTLNWKYLIEAVSSFTGSTLQLGVNGPQDPIVLRPEENQFSLHVIMPMHGVNN